MTKPVPLTETPGEVLVELMLSETDGGLDHLTVTIVKARDIAAKDSNARCDPVATVSLDAQEFSTEKMKGCRYPNFDKTFVFERAKLGPSLTISLRDASGGVKGGSLGHTIVKLDGLEHDIPRQAWHKLRPNPAEVKKLQEGCGSVRFSVSLSHDMILPLQSYNGLVGLLSDSIHDAATVETGLISTLEDILTDRELNADREQVARTLVRILLRQNRCTLFLKTLNDIEIQKSTSSGTLFRGNSMATKCTDQFMKVAGLTYLHGCLKKHIDAIFHEKKDCEIDPQTGRVSKKSDIDKHVGYLSDYITAILESIFTSISNCPASMRQCFKHLQEAVKTNATIMTSSDTPYTVVSGFLFLRFFAPAVLSPKLFGMREELADQRTHRTLTIIAKALQSIGNLVVKAQGAGKVDKEQFMAPLLPLIEQNHDRVRSFIDQLCTLDNKSIQDQFFPSKQVNATDAELVQRDVDSRTALVRGDVPARSESGKLFSNKSFKKRNFVLTHSMLQSSKVGDPTAELIKIPVDKILVAETMEASVHGKHVIVVSIGSRVRGPGDQHTPGTGFMSCSPTGLSLSPSFPLCRNRLALSAVGRMRLICPAAALIRRR